MPGTDAGRGAAGAGAVSLRPHTPERAAGGTDPCVRPPRDLGYHFLRESCLDFRYRDSYFGDLRCSPHSLSFRQALPNTSLHKTRGL